MSWIQDLTAYCKDNPKGYWFKPKLYGWGWMPVKWQGWLVIAIGVAIAVLSVYIGDMDDAPGAALIGVVVAVIFISVFGFWKGEMPHWQWGVPIKYKNKK